MHRHRPVSSCNVASPACDLATLPMRWLSAESSANRCERQLFAVHRPALASSCEDQSAGVPLPFYSRRAFARCLSHQTACDKRSALASAATAAAMSRIARNSAGAGVGARVLFIGDSVLRGIFMDLNVEGWSAATFNASRARVQWVGARFAWLGNSGGPKPWHTQVGSSLFDGQREYCRQVARDAASGLMHYFDYLGVFGILHPRDWGPSGRGARLVGGQVPYTPSTSCASFL